MVKKIWKDRKGVIAPLTAVLVIVLVIALAALAYFAVAQTSAVDGPNQNDQDLDGDGKADSVIGYIHIGVKVKTYNPAPDWGVDDDVQYTIEDATATLIDEEPTMSIWDGMEMWDDEDELKLTCKLTFPAYMETLISPSSAHEQWTQEYEGTAGNGPTTAYAYKDFYSGAIRYHGSYYMELTLFMKRGGEWVQQDIWKESVSI